VGDGTGQTVPAEGDGDLAGGHGGAREALGVLEALGAVDAERHAHAP
jgi:hypothetical protein